MSNWDPPPLANFVIFLLLLCLAFTPQVNAQSKQVMNPITGQMLPKCEPADLDTSVSFTEADVDFIVAFDLQNTSENACVPEPDVAFPEFDQQQGPNTSSFGLCVDCEDRTPNGTYRLHDPVLLNPGEIAHQTYQWKTTATSEAGKCLPLRALFTPVLVVTPTLFKQVCSEITVSRIHPGAFVPPSAKDEIDTDGAQSGDTFILSVRKPRYYLNEMFPLRVALANSVAGSPSGEECPTLFLRERAPDGKTRFDEVQPAAFKTCRSFTLGADRDADWRSGFEVDSGMRSRWTGVGEHSFELFAPIGSSQDGTIHFVRSNKLTVQIDDAALISRKWQGMNKGVRVDVTLDKDTYTLSEDVPLHIAIEDFDASVPLYAIDPDWDPYIAIGITVLDSTGHPLPENLRYPMHTIWMGHGLGPRPFPKGKVATLERTLATQGWLPNRPGVYTVVFTWCAFENTNSQSNPGLPPNDEFKTYATVQATTIIRILATSPSAPTLQH